MLVPHLQPGLEYSYGQSYEYLSDLRRCEDAIVDGLVMGGEEVSAQVFYVMVSFEDSPGPVDLSGVEFGFRNYDDVALTIIDHGLCNDDYLALPTDGWPGPNEGVVFLFHYPRHERIIELAWFAAYVYAPVTLPLGPDPATDVVGFSANWTPPTFDPVDDFNLGILAFGQEGYNPCAPMARDGACCVGSRCYQIYREDCEGRGGIYHGDNTSCFPNPCSSEERPTTWGTLRRMYASE